MARLNFTKAAIESLPTPVKGWTYHYDTKTRGLAIGVSHTGARSFLVYRKVQGKPERITLGRYPDLTIEQARGKAASINSAIAYGENPADKRRVARKEMTFGQLFAEYIERHAKPNKRSWERDADQYQRYLSDHLGRKKLPTIARTDIASIHSRVGKEHGTAANRALALVSSVFGRATEWGAVG